MYQNYIMKKNLIKTIKIILLPIMLIISIAYIFFNTMPDLFDEAFNKIKKNE